MSVFNPLRTLAVCASSGLNPSRRLRYWPQAGADDAKVQHCSKKALVTNLLLHN